jgi:hypothetical protein
MIALLIAVGALVLAVFAVAVIDPSRPWRSGSSQFGLNRPQMGALPL